MKDSDPPRPPWDLRQLRQDVQRTFGELQQSALSQCLDTVVERRFFARYHYNEARNMLDAALVGTEKRELVARGASA